MRLIESNTFENYIRDEIIEDKGAPAGAFDLYDRLLNAPGCESNREAFKKYRVPPGLYSEIDRLNGILKDDRDARAYEQRRNASHEIIEDINDQIKDANNDLKVAKYVLGVCNKCIARTLNPFNHDRSGLTASKTTLSWFKKFYPVVGCDVFTQATITQKAPSDAVNKLIKKQAWNQWNLQIHENLGEDSYNGSLTPIAMVLNYELGNGNANERMYHVPFAGYEGNKSSPVDSLIVLGNKSLRERDVQAYDIKEEHDALVTVVEFKHVPKFGEEVRGNAVAQGLAYATRLLKHVPNDSKATSSSHIRQLRVVAVNFMTTDETEMHYEVVTSIIRMINGGAKYIAYDPQKRVLTLPDLVELWLCEWEIAEMSDGEGARSKRPRNELN